MTTLDLIRYYARLLIVQYFDLPKAQDTIEAVVTPVIMPQTSVQTLTFSGIPYEGAFIVSYESVLAAAINWDDDTATIQTTLRAIPALAAVTVTGSPLDGLITITMEGVTPVAELLVVESSTLVTGFDGGFADTEDFGITIEAGDAFTTSTNFIDGGDAFGTGGIAVTVTVGETDKTLPLAVQDGYNLIGDEIAVGVQLDVIGKYVGVTRTGLGFNGQITLSDADFLSLIRMAIIKNNSDSSLKSIQDLLFRYFPTTSILVFDYQNMRISYLISTAFGSLDLIQLFVREKILPKPMAVQLAAVIYVPDITQFFGYRTYEAAAVNAKPFNTYEDYNETWPWLDYADAVVI